VGADLKKKDYLFVVQGVERNKPAARVKNHLLNPGLLLLDGEHGLKQGFALLALLESGIREPPTRMELNAGGKED